MDNDSHKTRSRHSKNLHRTKKFYGGVQASKRKSNLILVAIQMTCTGDEDANRHTDGIGKWTTSTVTTHGKNVQADSTVLKYIL